MAGRDGQKQVQRRRETLRLAWDIPAAAAPRDLNSTLRPESQTSGPFAVPFLMGKGILVTKGTGPARSIFNRITVAKKDAFSTEGNIYRFQGLRPDIFGGHYAAYYTIFYLTRFVQNTIILTCNQYFFIINEIFSPFFILGLQNQV